VSSYRPAIGSSDFLNETHRKHGSPPLRVLETQSTFHPHAQRNAFRPRDARLQSRSFARWKQSLKHSPNSNRLLPRFSAMISYSRSHHAVICVYDEAGDVIETHEHKGDFREP
jgi:hypothetical protein